MCSNDRERQCVWVTLWMPDTPGGSGEVHHFEVLVQGDSEGLEFLIFCLSGIQGDNSDIYCTVPVVSDLDKLLSQCLSQHAITFVSLHLSLSLRWSQHAFSLLSSPVSSPHPSLRRSQHVTFFISSISLSTRLSVFLPKCDYQISIGVSDTQIHQTCLFSFWHPQLPSSFLSDPSWCPVVVMIVWYNESCSWLLHHSL